MVLHTSRISSIHCREGNKVNYRGKSKGKRELYLALHVFQGGRVVNLRRARIQSFVSTGSTQDAASPYRKAYDDYVCLGVA